MGKDGGHGLTAFAHPTARFVEAMNGLLQQTKTAARGFRNTDNFIAIAYLRMSKLKHLPDNPLVPAAPRSLGCYLHTCPVPAD